MEKLKRIAEPLVLICEGVHDREFFKELCRLNADLPRFDILSVNYVLGGPADGGNSRFTDVLDELAGIPGFEHIERILIVADNDLDPDASFDAVVNQINDAAEILGPPKRKYIAPNAAKTKAGANPSITILMLPDTGTNGSLDTMCWASAAEERPVEANCVNQFATCTHADQWTENKASKMRLRSLISATYRDNPYLSPAYVWSKGTDLVPLDNRLFSGIVAFLRDFPEL